MITDSIKGIATEHDKSCGKFYFLPQDKISIVISGVFISFLATVLIAFGAFIELLVLLSVFFMAIFFLGLLPAYKRAKLISEGCHYYVSDGFIESDFTQKKERFSYKGKQVKYIKRRKGVADIVIGNSVADFFKYFGSIGQPKLWICGVTNGQEVIEYIYNH